MHYAAYCRFCDLRQHEAGAIACAGCGGPLEFRYEGAPIVPDARFDGTMWRYWRRLPVARPEERVTLDEGGTPLLPSRLPEPVRLAWKDETRNPTGSHKDRALALALTHAKAIGARLSLVVSAGSTGLANAAYAARAGLPSVTLIPAGAPRARIQPLAAYGSRLIEVAGGIDAVIAAAQAMAGYRGIYVASTTRASNPVQAEAAKTIALEIVDQAGEAPEWVLAPTGGGGTIAGLWRGFLEARADGRATRLPRLVAIVPQAYDALRAGLAGGVGDERAFAALSYSDDVPTVLTKLSHAHPPDGLEALAAIRESRGTVVAVSDEAAIAGTYAIAAADGLYLEPSSGVVAPALNRLLQDGVIVPGAEVVALACGSGFRETFALVERTPASVEHATIAELAALLA